MINELLNWIRCCRAAVTQSHPQSCHPARATPCATLACHSNVRLSLLYYHFLFVFFVVFCLNISASPQLNCMKFDIFQGCQRWQPKGCQAVRSQALLRDRVCGFGYAYGLWQEDGCGTRVRVRGLGPGQLLSRALRSVKISSGFINDAPWWHFVYSAIRFPVIRWMSVRLYIWIFFRSD